MLLKILKEMVNFLDTYVLTKQRQEDIKIANRTTINNDIRVATNLLRKKSSSPHGFSAKIYQISMEEPNVCAPQNYSINDTANSFQTSFYEASATLQSTDKAEQNHVD